MYVHSFKKRNFNSNQHNAKFICVQKYTFLVEFFFTLVFTFVIKTDILGQFLKFDTMLTILKEGRMVNKLCMRF